MMILNLLDPVVLNEDLVVLGLKCGDIGAVVEIYSSEDFEVEFVTGSDRTPVLVPLRLNQIRPAGPKDIFSVRL